MYENLVAIELLRREYEVYVGKLYDKEVDFIAIKNSRKIYLQVCDDLYNLDTFKREVLPLKSINDLYPKIVIARTKAEAYDYEEIEIIDIAKWLNE